MRFAGLGAVCLSLFAPAVAFAEDVTVSLPGAVVPVGPAGTTVLEVSRSVVAGERFAVIRARAPEQASRCGAAPERVAVWGLLDGRWTEMAHELLDRCPAPGPVAGRPAAPRAVRARVVDVAEGAEHRAEFHLRLVDPRLPVEQSPVVRFHRVGDRFAQQRVTDVVAAAPGAPTRAFAAITGASADGRLTEWAGMTPAATGERGSLWMAQQGERLMLAADLAAGDDGAPTLTVHLGEYGAGTAHLRANTGNHGRVVHLACGEGARCERAGDRWHVEGSLALGAQVFRQRQVEAIEVLAFAEAGGHRLASTTAGMRLEAVRLAQPMDLLRGASPEVLARCEGGYVGRVSAPGGASGLEGALVTCGESCRDGMCEQLVGTGSTAGRLEWSRAGTCFRGTGPGREEVDGCRAGASTRLLGVVGVRGFDLVLGVERSWSIEGARWRQGELWALVTATAQWQQLRVGAAQRGDQPLYASVGMAGGHPTLCRAGAEGTCETFGDLTLEARESQDSVTGTVVSTLREAGLGAQRGSRVLGGR